MAEILSIVGGKKLQGNVRVAGAKNAALPLLIACLLNKEPCVIENVPNLEDISVTLRLLQSLGAEVSFHNHTAKIQARELHGVEAPYGLVKALRASFWVLGPLLARQGEARVALPGGDAIGTRPVDLHLKGLEQFGADIRMEHGVVKAVAPTKLRGANINLTYPSVGATHQLLMTAAYIPEQTIIRGAAKEPEVVELANFLCSMGAQISGQGTSEIRIMGSQDLHSAKTVVLGDRIEAATYLAAGAITVGSVCVEGIVAESFSSTLEILEKAGCELTISADSICIKGVENLRAVSFETMPFPGVATDVQPLLMALLTKARGESSIYETVFENRFGHVAEFRRFGAQISIEGHCAATIRGVEHLSGAPVEAGDIRAAAALVLMGLAAEGRTEIQGVHHLDRGYDSLLEKFKALGANIMRVPMIGQSEVVFGC